MTSARPVLLLGIASCLLAPRLATGNTGIPMLALAWPIAWCLLPAVIVSEAYFARRELGLAWGASLRLSGTVNLISTLVGIPLAWLLMLVLEFAAGVTSSVFKLKHPAWRVFLFPFESAWLAESEHFWPLYLSGAVLCIPFCVASIWIERRSAIRRLGAERAPEVARWSLRANVASYAAIIAGLLLLAAFDAARNR